LATLIIVVHAAIPSIIVWLSWHTRGRRFNSRRQQDIKRILLRLLKPRAGSLGIRVVGLHHGVLVCTVWPHISTKSHGVLLTFPRMALVGERLVRMVDWGTHTIWVGACPGGHSKGYHWGRIGMVVLLTLDGANR
jgi:hypothetical protein